MKIYPPSGTVELYEMPKIYEGCIEKFTLMQEDYIELHFNSVDPIYFPIGSYTTWNDKKYYIIEAQQPSYDESTGGYNYELKFEAYYRAWQMKIYKYSPDVDKKNNKDNGKREAEFSLTANLENQIITFVRCLNKEGFRYNDNELFDYNIVTDSENAAHKAYFNEVKTMTYSSVNFIEALNQIADEWDAEWWVEDKFICFGKCQLAGEATEFKLGENVVSMSGSKSETDYATRVYAFGSDKNLPKNYGKGHAVFTLDSNPQFKDNYSYFKTDKPLYSNFFNKSDRLDNSDPIFNLKKGTLDTLVPAGVSGVICYTNVVETSSIVLGSGEYKDTKFYLNNNVKSTNFGVCINYSFKNFLNDGSTFYTITAFVILCGDKNGSEQTFNVGKDVQVENVITSKKFTTEISVNRYNNQGSKYLGDVTFSTFTLTQEQNISIKILVGVTFTNKFVNGTIDFGIGYPAGGFADTLSYFRNSKEVLTRVVVRYQTQEEGKPTDTVEAVLITSAELFPNYGTNYIRFKEIRKYEGRKVTIDNIIESKLPSWYFESETDIQNSKSIKAIAERRLSLPYPYYVEASNVPFNSIVEKVLVFDDIYPCIKSLITKIEPKPQYVYENDEKTDIKYTEYYIHTDDFTFDEDYKLDTADKLEIKFQTGALSGLTFEAIFHPKAIFNQEEPPQQYFQIVRQQFDGGIYLPSDAMHPELGDEFILIGWDASRIEDLGLIKDAEKRLAERTKFEIDKVNIDPTTYECTMFSDYTYGLAKETLVTDDNGVVLTDERGIAIRTDESSSGLDESNKNIFKIGQRVKLWNAAFFEKGYRDSRIIGYERKMDIPYDSPVYMVGEKAIYSKFSSLEKSIKQLKTK